jgi:hypothetical protein
LDSLGLSATDFVTPASNLANSVTNVWQFAMSQNDSLYLLCAAGRLFEALHDALNV